MVDAIDDLVDEGVKAVEASTERMPSPTATAREIFRKKTMIVLAAVDPVKVCRQESEFVDIEPLNSWKSF